MRVNLLPLELHDFDVILGMDWLGGYRAQIDYFAKTVTLQEPDGRRVIFRRNRNVILNCIISVMTSKKMIKKGCETYLAHVLETKRKIFNYRILP